MAVAEPGNGQAHGHVAVELSGTFALSIVKTLTNTLCQRRRPEGHLNKADAAQQQGKIRPSQFAESRSSEKRKWWAHCKVALMLNQLIGPRSRCTPNSEAVRRSKKDLPHGKVPAQNWQRRLLLGRRRSSVAATRTSRLISEQPL